MSLSREAIVDQLKEIVGSDRVITDETVLKRNSIDRFRKYADIHGVFTLPLPAAVVKLGSTEQVSNVLAFMNQHKINGVPRTGASATEGGLETVVENSVVLDGAGMNQILNIDIENMQATAQCGVPLEVLENALRSKGYTTGHSPQSKPLRPCWRMVPSPASKTSRAAPPGRTFATSSSATKVHCAISLK